MVEEEVVVVEEEDDDEEAEERGITTAKEVDILGAATTCKSSSW